MRTQIMPNLERDSYAPLSSFRPNTPCFHHAENAIMTRKKERLLDFQSYIPYHMPPPMTMVPTYAVYRSH